MEFVKYEKYRALILRIFLGFTVLFWGYEKITLEKLVGGYTMDYGPFMLIDVNLFVSIAGWTQVLMGILLFLGLFTRLNAAIMVLMGLTTIIVPGLIVMKDVTHFAYAFALTGAALALLIEGAGRYSLDRKLWSRQT
jgi:putative oxidoreductase